jgi:hypothetical protein
LLVIYTTFISNDARSHEYKKKYYDFILDRENYPDRLEGPTSFFYLGTLPSLSPSPPGGGSVWGGQTTTHPHLVPWLNMSAATSPTAMWFNRVYGDAFAFRSYLYIHVWVLLKLLPVFLESSRRCCKPSKRITITQLTFIFISIRTNKFTTLEAKNCSLFDNTQIGSGAQQASYSVKFQELCFQGRVTGGNELYLHSPYTCTRCAYGRFLHYLNLKTNS